MTVLGFERRARFEGGRRVREARFELRSALAVSAACVVANAVRETLAALLAAPVALRLVEPVLPDPAAWIAIGREARIYGVRGPLADAAFVLRAPDALALAGAAFGEPADPARRLSALESEVVARALRSLSGSLAPLCGREYSRNPDPQIAGYSTYFELLVEQPAAFRIGVAVSREPAPGPAGTLRIADLLDVQVDVDVRLAVGTLSTEAFLDLRPGADMPMTSRVGESGLLVAGGVVLARGECGAFRDRSALLVSSVEEP